jgi:hypothetical protein
MLWSRPTVNTALEDVLLGHVFPPSVHRLHTRVVVVVVLQVTMGRTQNMSPRHCTEANQAPCQHMF